MADQKLTDLTALPSAIAAGDKLYVVRSGTDYQADANDLGGAALLDVGTTAGTVCAGDDSRLSDPRTPSAHKTSHENGGADEINVAGLSGELADPQPPKNHDHSANKLAQANTHESPDTDVATTSLHHTLGTSANQAAAGNHTHAGVYEPVQTAASQAEMEAGTETAIRSMTPQRVAQAIAALATGTKTLVTFEASDLQPPASNYHAFDTRTILAASFRDTTADDSALLVKRMPEGANLASGVTVYFEWVVAGTSTSGNVIWQIEFARLNADNQDLDSITFDTATVASASAANGTAGKITKPSISIAAADLDGITAGDLFVMRITRLQSNGSDTLADKAMILGGEIRSAA